MRSQQQNSGTSAIKVSRGRQSFKLARVGYATHKEQEIPGEPTIGLRSYRGRSKTERKSEDFKIFSNRIGGHEMKEGW